MWMRRSFRYLAGIVLIACVLGQPAVLTAQPGNAPERVPVLIGFRDTPGPNQQALVRAHGGVIKYSYTLVPAIAASIPERAIQALQANPSVALIEPDIKAYAVADSYPWGVTRIGANAVHAAGGDGFGVRVAVIDSGVAAHPDLTIVDGWDFVNDDDDPTDDNGHGTHVAGTIAALWNNSGVIGVAPEATLCAVKVLGANGSGDYSDIIAGLEWCWLNDIDIANLSLGSSGDPGTTVKNAFDTAYYAEGILIVAAAGNSGTRTGKGDNVIYPARYDSVIAVAASNSSDVRASFSSTGPAVELTAPGVSIYSTIPGGSYAYYSGTSMASPHAAGAAALVWAAKGDTWSNADVRAALTSTSLDLGAAGRDSLYGYGLVQVAWLTTGGGGGGESGTVMVDSITYSLSRNKRHLNIEVALVDDAHKPVAGASVAIQVSGPGIVASGTGTTGSDGTVMFTLSNAPFGTYTTVVTNVSASGYTWDGETPPNSYSK